MSVLTGKIKNLYDFFMERMGGGEEASRPSNSDGHEGTPGSPNLGGAAGSPNLGIGQQLGELGYKSLKYYRNGIKNFEKREHMDMSRFKLNQIIDQLQRVKDHMR